MRDGVGAFPMALLAERARLSRTTLTKVEKGDPGTSMGAYATILFVLGMTDRLADLADARHDGIGLALEEERLPRRVRITEAEQTKRGRLMERSVLVFADLGGVSHLTGRLWSRARRGQESASFEYDKNWLAHPERFALEPALTLGPGPHHTRPGKALFGAIGDSAPDRWGRVLMRRAERRRAAKANSAARTLLETDFLLLVDDESRHGALRFQDHDGGPFLAPAGPARIPPLVELPKLLSASERVIGETDTDEDLRLLLAPGSSLGGARPKASIRDRDGAACVGEVPARDRRDRCRAMGSPGADVGRASGYPRLEVAYRDSRRQVGAVAKAL